jgi:hypothetical protein
LQEASNNASLLPVITKLAFAAALAFLPASSEIRKTPQGDRCGSLLRYSGQRHNFLGNYRARFNCTFAIAAEGFSAGQFCPLPEHVPQP